MMTYFEKLNVYVPDVVEAGAPILINEVALIKDTVDDEILLRITMANSIEKAVIAVAVKIQMWDVFGDEVSVDGVPYKEYVYQDISFSPLSIYGNTVPIKLPDSVRRVNVVITRVVFSDGTVWKSNPDNYVHVQQQDLLEGTDDFLETLRSDGEKYPPILTFAENKECWQCTCGGVNKKGTEKCYRCGRKRDFCFKAYSADVIHDEFAAFVEEKKRIADEKRKAEEARKKAEEERRRIKEAEEAEKKRLERERIAEQERIEEEKRKIREEENRQRKKKVRKRLIVSFVSIAVIAIGIATYIKVINPMIKYNKAQRLYNEGDYSDAEKEYASLGNYKDSETKKQLSNAQNLYQESVALSENSDLQGAFEKINATLSITDKLPDEYGKELGEKASADKTELYYRSAKIYMDKNKYKDAIECLKNSQGYKDSDELLRSVTYKYAIRLKNKKEYVAAMNYFENVSDYKDSVDLYYDCLYGEWKKTDAVTCITYGKYEQDNNSENGPEPIAWIILKMDKKKHHMLLVSRIPIERMTFMKYDVQSSLSWTESSVRKWLNKDFYNESFSDDEKTRIIKTVLKTNKPDNKIEETKDYIYIPKRSTINEYKNELVWDWKKTDISYIGAKVSILYDSWIRDFHKSDARKVLTLHFNGDIREEGELPTAERTVRPMMWIDYSRKEESKAINIRLYTEKIEQIETNDTLDESNNTKKETTNNLSASVNRSHSSNTNSHKEAYGYDPSDPYYSAADHNGDGKLTDDEFQEAMGKAIDDLAARMG